MRLTKYWKYTKILMKIDDEENIISLLLGFRKKFKSLHYTSLIPAAKFATKEI